LSLTAYSINIFEVIGTKQSKLKPSSHYNQLRFFKWFWNVDKC